MVRTRQTKDEERERGKKEREETRLDLLAHTCLMCPVSPLAGFELFLIQLPLTLLRAATGSPLLVELKGGDTYNGRLASIDAYMNMNLVEVICTSADGARFWKLSGAYIRGSAVKYLRLPPTLLQEAAVQEAAAADERRQAGGGRGRGRGGRAGGRGGR